MDLPKIDPELDLYEDLFVGRSSGPHDFVRVEDDLTRNLYRGLASRHRKFSVFIPLKVRNALAHDRKLDTVREKVMSKLDQLEGG